MAPAVLDEITCPLTIKRISQEINTDLLQLCPKAHGLVLKDPAPDSISEAPISQDFIPPAPISYDPSSPFLQISPYTAPLHLLDLSTLDLTHQLLAHALTHLVPLTPRYATTPYHLAFNWAHAISHLPPSFPASSYYCIVFRSRVAPNAPRAHLGELDAEAHREAVASGGLLKYWYGTPDAEGRNLATCVWRGRGDARKGGAGKGHAKAMMAARGAYVEWGVERLRLVIGEGGREWNIEEWVE